MMIRLACETCGVGFEDFDGESRREPIVRARAIVTVLMVKGFGLTTNQAAKATRRRHFTAHYHVDNHLPRRKSDKVYDETFRQVAQKMGLDSMI